MPGRHSLDYQTTDLISDILSNGKSSRLYRKLVQEKHQFSEINAFITGDIEPGMFVVTGRPAEGVSMEEAEKLLWEELEGMKENPPSEYELEKVKNRFESTVMFSEVSILSKAMNLGFYELLGDANLINKEMDNYRRVKIEDITRVSKTLFIPERCSTLLYLPETNSNHNHA